MEVMMMAPGRYPVNEGYGGGLDQQHSVARHQKKKKRAENTEALGAADHVAAYVPGRVWKIKNKKIGPKKE
jgi:hypothetical protein